MRVDLGGQLRELDEPVAGDAPGLVLLGLADVDQLDLALFEQLGDLLRRVVLHVREASRCTLAREMGFFARGEEQDDEQSEALARIEGGRHPEPAPRSG